MNNIICTRYKYTYRSTFLLRELFVQKIPNRFSSESKNSYCCAEQKVSQLLLMPLQ